MKVEATVDVGNNLTSLLERLAQQIGTTVDKVYPWYVQQAYLEGVTTLVGLAVAWVVLVPIFILAIRKIDWEKGNGWVPVAFITGMAMFATSLVTLFDAADSARKVMNPNFYAMQMLTADIGRMRGR